jgi:hypothetical protein
MSALGQKQTYAVQKGMSALGQKRTSRDAFIGCSMRHETAKEGIESPPGQILSTKASGKCPFTAIATGIFGMSTKGAGWVLYPL